MALMTAPPVADGPAKDPVCGMEFDPSQAPTQTTYKREPFFFCCASCRKTFEDRPDLYARQTDPPDVAPVPMN